MFPIPYRSHTAHISIPPTTTTKPVAHYSAFPTLYFPIHSSLTKQHPHHPPSTFHSTSSTHSAAHATSLLSTAPPRFGSAISMDTVSVYDQTAFHCLSITTARSSQASGTSSSGRKRSTMVAVGEEEEHGVGEEEARVGLEV